MRPRSLQPSPLSPRSAGRRLLAWWLGAALAASCLNPQPDPFPQADNAPENQSRTGNDTVVPASAPPANAPLAPAPAPDPEEQSPVETGPTVDSAGAPLPPAAPQPDAGAPPPDAGSDAGGGDGPLVGGG